MRRGIAHHLFLFFAHLGGFGILLLSVLDSSPLLIPLGNDVLFIAMTARNHGHVVYYTVMAVVGSVVGCLSVDELGRKGGDKALHRIIPARRLKSIKQRMKKSAGWALALAAIMPPPFPFTAFVGGAAALQYPRKKLIAVITTARLVRFSIEGTLAILFGRHILRLARSPAVVYIVVGLIVVSIAGSAVSILSWVRQSKPSSSA